MIENYLYLVVLENNGQVAYLGTTPNLNQAFEIEKNFLNQNPQFNVNSVTIKEFTYTKKNYKIIEKTIDNEQ